MTQKLTLAAIALVLLPSVTLAGGNCPFGGHEQAISCATGTSWDSETGTCVPQTTS